MIIVKKKVEAEKVAAPVVAIPGGDAPKKVKKSPAKVAALVAAKKKAASETVHYSAKVGKGGLRGKYRCMCGCNGKTDNTFLRGHVQRVRGWILRARVGEGSPTKLGMPKELVLKLGPWKRKGDGLVPSKKYDALVR